ncbi:MAG: UDP-N-acetylmuramoyl-tripeptide--D-alanyl-D-alanine ligase [Crocinitomicaceae bacterium]|nr:UDP-N-acetylmuramoyl-tripeptide--D-alanyl-D-alanine ligase [Crocinitomicaceae bacterium]
MEKIFELFYQCNGISTDTRNVQDQAMFICIKGENFDGNTFASKALEKGANHVIVDNPSYFQDNGRMSLVDNSVSFLQKLANYHRKKFNIPVIGITGSNGKTSTKELINVVLSKKYNVLATIGNLNNHLGVPFTLLRLNSSHEIAIIEMGANRFKDIEELCVIAEPTHGIITNIGKAHLEGFINFSGVLKTKKELFESVESNHGVIIRNSDDDILTSIAPKSIKNFTYGTKHANVCGELINLSPYVEMTWSTNSSKSQQITTQMIGKYNFYNYLAAAAFGKLFEVNDSDISEAIESYTPTNNRSQVKKTNKNTLILDCYNANPTSMKSAIESFAMNDHPSKLLILGDMKELGDDSHNEHQSIIKQLEELSLNAILVGEEFFKFDSHAILNKFKSTDDLLSNIDQFPLKQKLILLKGSRSIGLERLESLL